jgi:hypothetical protein
VVLARAGYSKEKTMAIYKQMWRNKWLTAEAKSIAEMSATLRAAADELDGMAAAGIVLDPESDMESDYADLVTEDPKVAEEFGLEEDPEEDDEDDLEEDHRS